MSGNNFKVLMDILAQEKSEVEILNFLLRDKSVEEMIEMLGKGDEVLTIEILTKIKDKVEKGSMLLINNKKKLMKNLCGKPLTENLTDLLNEILFVSNVNDPPTKKLKTIHVQTGGGENVVATANAAGSSHNLTVCINFK